MKTRKQILSEIRAHLPFQGDVQEETALAELGVSSLHLVTLVLALQRQYGLDIGQLIQLGMPVTVGDVVTFVEGNVRSS